MAAHGAALQTQNNELVKCIEELREKREFLSRSIREEEAEKAKIQQDLQARHTAQLYLKDHHYLRVAGDTLMQDS